VVVYTQVTTYDPDELCCLVIHKAGKALISIAAVILGALSISAPADGSEFRIQPSILLSEEYNDNVLLTTQNRSDDYITRAAPSLSVVYLAPRWDWKMDYAFNYQYYSKRTIDNQSTHTLNLSNTNRIAADVLFLVVQDQYSRVSLDIMRDYTQESNFVNQSDRNLLTVNPYLLLRPLSQMTVTTGYIYTDTWYKDPLAIGRTDHIGYADIWQTISPRSALLAGIKHTLDITTIENYTQDDLYLGLNYEFAENSSVMLKVGNSWFDSESTGRSSQAFWDATLSRRYPKVTVTYETGLRFVTDPLGIRRREDRYLATVRKDVERSSIAVSGGLLEYREAIHNNLENTIYRLTGSISHALSIKSKIMIDLTAERLKDYLLGVSTDRYLTGARFEHLAMENLTLALDYRYTNVYSPDVYSLNYYNNRVTVELRKVF
jgi:hypothetical protein